MKYFYNQCTIIFNGQIKWTSNIAPVTNSEMSLYNFTIAQLKDFSKHYGLKVTGKKYALYEALYTHLFLSTCVIRIQKRFRGHIRRLFNLLHGPALYNRSICTNHCDFVTLDALTDISSDSFFSYQDVDGFVYGFDIGSLRDFICMSKTCYNPYNRKPIPSHTINDFESVIAMSKLFHTYKTNAIIEPIILSDKQRIELRALDVFESLGNYSNSSWFNSLNNSQLMRFMRHLADIYGYRSQLTIEQQHEICVTPFSRMRLLSLDSDIYFAKTIVLEIMEKFVNDGVTHDARCLGALYVLTALTLVSTSAAEAFPWLYQSVVTF
jgi:hypothetical protein